MTTMATGRRSSASAAAIDTGHALTTIPTSIAAVWQRSSSA
ncbi:hypothetical protein SCE1572_21030 [Sorangium cellulosum So0157-2]|uniref:Uncharacterized protein n=1 Tax=Sorangium cellulosum So0157-2 TaxID=1254432 RepID=S4XWK4_SORCE|nr:hypothetical protein SCE1572_21030 [Sorangium cellulosum So0157-2]